MLLIIFIIVIEKVLWWVDFQTILYFSNSVEWLIEDVLKEPLPSGLGIINKSGKTSNTFIFRFQRMENQFFKKGN